MTLTPSQISEIRILRREHEYTYAELMEKFGVSKEELKTVLYPSRKGSK